MAAEGVKTRPNIAAKEKGPGPGRYGLPTTVGANGHDMTKKQSSAFTFGTHLGTTMGKKTVGPGPSHFVQPQSIRTGKTKGPSWSVPGRAKDFKTPRVPGPGAYKPETVKIDKGSIAPQYTMRKRTEHRKKDIIPASNAYGLPTAVGVAPKYSMTGRSNIGGFAQDLAKAPGPGKYSKTSPNVDKNQSPRYSMRPRTKMPQDPTKKPGPGAHCPEKVTVNKKKAPSFNMGVKHSQYTLPLIVDVMD